jgi:hypothetical protein
MPEHHKTCLCGAEFTAHRTTTKWCSVSCRDRHRYRKNREKKLVAMRAYAKRRWAAMSEEQRDRKREHRRMREARYRLIRKITEGWHVGAKQAREWLKTGSFPP